MAQGKKSNGSQYQSIGGGRVVDKERKTVYPANKIDQIYAISQADRKNQKKG